ncbi:hypothetical protein HAX54_033287 [Datura stramonium]|uniref:Uncharacterized protein n=1 Tax=Datura stramonium TaxID=4076 RepID=A0ABS8VCT8_DATST|nr:hypothetical protein [Datura stramonium]
MKKARKWHEGKRRWHGTKEIAVSMPVVARQWHSGRQMRLGNSAGRGRGVAVKDKQLAPSLGAHGCSRTRALVLARIQADTWRRQLGSFLVVVKNSLSQAGGLDCRMASEKLRQKPIAGVESAPVTPTMIRPCHGGQLGRSSP